MELRSMVSAGMEKGRSHATVAGGKLMELWLRGWLVREWRREGAMPRLLEVSEWSCGCGDEKGKEPCHGCLW